MVELADRAHKVSPPTDGCKLHSNCETCPLPDCEYETKYGQLGNRRYIRYRERYEKMIQLRAKGMIASQIAKRIGVSRIRIYQMFYEQDGCTMKKNFRQQWNSITNTWILIDVKTSEVIRNSVWRKEPYKDIIVQSGGKSCRY